jgi:hypothetical protein
MGARLAGSAAVYGTAWAFGHPLRDGLGFRVQGPPLGRDSSKSWSVFSLVRGLAAGVGGGGSGRCGGFLPCTWLLLVAGRE